MNGSGVRFQRLAEKDVAEAYDWYEGQKPGLGGELLDAIDACCQRIQRNPEEFPKVRRSARRALVKRFPFCVYFVIDGSGARFGSRIRCEHFLLTKRWPGARFAKRQWRMVEDVCRIVRHADLVHHAR